MTEEWEREQCRNEKRFHNAAGGSKAVEWQRRGRRDARVRARVGRACREVERLVSRIEVEEKETHEETRPAT